MENTKITFERLEGDSFDTGVIVLSAIYKGKKALIRTNFVDLNKFQKELAQELGTPYVDAFKEISLSDLDILGGAMIEIFFEDALSRQFIVHSRAAHAFFRSNHLIKEQKADSNDNHNIEIISDTIPQSQQQQLQESEGLFFPVQVPSQIEPQPYWKQRQQELQKQQLSFLQYLKQQQQQQHPRSNQSIVSQAHQFSSSNIGRRQQQSQQQQEKQPNVMHFPVNEEKRNQSTEQIQKRFKAEKKIFHFSQYFRRKILHQFKFLFRHQRSIQSNGIKDVFHCRNCAKSMAVGTKCFKCKNEQNYYCKKCTTSCVQCGSVLKNNKNSSNILELDRLLHRQYTVCNGCGDEIVLANFQMHLFICEESRTPCKYCKQSLLFKDMKRHLERECANRPIKCDKCDMMFLSSKKDQHYCEKKLQIARDQADLSFSRMKEGIMSKIRELRNKLEVFL